MYRSGMRQSEPSRATPEAKGRPVAPKAPVAAPMPTPLGRMSVELQRTIGNQATGRLLSARLPGARRGGPTLPIQRFGEMSELRKTGWRYSGGTMATHSGIDTLWHASVFRVDKSGKPAADGLFYNGFHLTMPYGPMGAARIEPHVFFDSTGKYDAVATEGHTQTKNYLQAVGKTQFDFDLQTAKDLAKNVVAVLAPALTDEQREAMEKERAQKKEQAKEQEEQAAAAAAKQKELEQEKAAAAADEDSHIGTLLTDVRYTGGSYKEQFKKYVAGDKTAIKSENLKKVAEWYLAMRGTELWIITEDPKAAYKDWGKTPIKVAWPEYKNAESRTWRAKSDTGLMSEFRKLKFTGYASYKTHPKAKKPPAV